jgi:hypothetical protein
MTTFNEPQEDLPNKIIYLGHYGSGKTGSLASLAAAGYNVRIMDVDKKVQILRDYMLNAEKSPYLRAMPGLWTAEQARGTAERLSYVSLDETMVLAGATGKERYIPKGDLWGKAMGLMNNWDDGPKRAFGNIGTWGAKDVLVLDGLSRLGQAAMDQQLALSGNLTKYGSVAMDARPDINSAQIMIARLLQTLQSSVVKCHVIVICHIAMNTDETGVTSGFPQSIGNKLGPRIGQYFSHALLAKQQGDKRVITTSTGGMVRLMTPAPLRVRAEYDLSTGLAEYFRDVSGPAGSGGSTGSAK